jgi:hypothetical protein
MMSTNSPSVLLSSTRASVSASTGGRIGDLEVRIGATVYSAVIIGAEVASDHLYHI